MLAVAVDQHDRQAAVGEAGVAVHPRGGVGVQPGDEDDAADAAIDEQLGELVFRRAAGQLGAEHRRVAVLGQRLLDGLRERGEDRVVQLRRDQTDQPVAALPQPGRAFVAHQVERGHHRLAGGGRDSGLAVEHPADGGLAHPGLGGDVGETSVTVHGPYFTFRRAAESVATGTSEAITSSPSTSWRRDSRPGGSSGSASERPSSPLRAPRASPGRPPHEISFRKFTQALSNSKYGNIGYGPPKLLTETLPNEILYLQGGHAALNRDVLPLQSASSQVTRKVWAHELGRSRQSDQGVSGRLPRSRPAEPSGR